MRPYTLSIDTLSIERKAKKKADSHRKNRAMSQNNAGRKGALKSLFYAKKIFSKSWREKKKEGSFGAPIGAYVNLRESRI